MNTKDATTAAAETFLNNATKNVFDIMSTIFPGANTQPDYQNVFRFFSQQLTQVTYIEESNYYIVESQVSGSLWDLMYRDVLRDLDESARVVSLEEVTLPQDNLQKENRMAVVEVMTVLTFSILVETFGDVPYSSSLDPENVTPQFDDQQAIYYDLIDRLSRAIDKMDVSTPGFERDIVYGGNMDKWKKFANSLKLKMGLRIMDVNPGLGSTTVTEAVQSGVFASNDDNFELEYLNTTPNTNPLWVALVQSGRQYYVAAEPLVDTMNDLGDPRREAFFQTVGGDYIGGVYGQVQPYSSYSPMGTRFFEPDLPGIIMDYAFVEFLLAEAAERSLIGTPAQGHYDSGIRASFEYYGAAGVEDYLAQANVDYSTAPGDWKEKIGIQKWIALYNQGFEAWTEYRRLGHPILTAPANAYIDEVPVRLTYPISEQTLNQANYTAASSAIGGDLLTTHLFWDAN